MGDKLISLEGAYDIHIHSSPCLFPRIADDRGIVESARDAGLAGVMLKCHHESTVSRARALQQQYQDIQVYGGIVLNEYVGGLNPFAAEAALRLGAKQIWMPTIDAQNHATVHGSKGKYDVQDGRKNEAEKGQDILDGISIYDHSGNISNSVKEILELITQYDAILGTCHLSKSEIFDLVREAKKIGVKKILLTHPYFKVPNLELDEIKELISMGVTAEFGFCTVSPMWHYTTVQNVAYSIQELGAENCIIISDGGQRHNPMPHEGLRIFAQCLYECGITEDQLKTLMIENQKQLLGISHE